jgi:hypothetical protein
MQRLEVSCAKRPMYGSLGAKWLRLKIKIHGYMFRRLTYAIIRPADIKVSLKLRYAKWDPMH